ncbi:DUF4401 domain-containing protein [Shewanella schlegeliana]|uniref:DUF4401 domain-containing protein n=1 Tax=Shewanella schlegeliana TaxID=190308 RepID=A0ABS1T2R2_9GAMM|nr:DUF4401 domain-containing protein [Shewanella schlegeliana]MBL4915091.1 DUF4401 domain-containing protein [Shewanella schlegeliana]MCL1111043.1 DUF4401 domain-containing protein [Shewanella schlegeliana]GIU29080.1 hypothetical protein TUM4433_17910 [Shewanella schlegeliana]
MTRVLADNTKGAQAKLWSRFVAEGLTSQDEMPAMLQTTPWYVQVMQTFAAWVASVFILAFSITFFGLFLDDLDTGFATVVGLFYAGIAVYLYRVNAAKSLFVNQMAFALSLCGLLSLAYGMTDWFSPNLGGEIGLAWYFTLGCILLLHWLLIEHYSHQCVMSFGLIACLVGIGYELQLFELLSTLILLLFAGVWLNHAKTAKHFARMSALGHMLALWVVLIQLPLLASQSLLLDHDEFPVLAQWSNGLSVVTTLLILSVLLVRIFRSQSLSLSSKQALLSAFVMLLLAGLSITMTGLSAAVVIMIMGFYVKERAVFLLGLVGILSFITWYYYSLQLPLLEKSIWLVALGSLLILARLLLVKLLPKVDKHGANHNEA